MKSMTKNKLLEWFCFALIATLFCLLLAFRPIPSEGSDNDTVRYVSDLHEYCSRSLSKDIWLNKEISYQFFYLITSPACIVKSDGIFLFEVAAFLPLMFLLFSRWRNGVLLWASSLLFSVYGLELMTNAMRQGLAMLFFFGGLSLLHQHPRKAALLGFLAVAAHTSVVPFLPLMLWLSGARLSARGWLAIVLLVIFALAVGGVMFGGTILEFGGSIGELHNFYTSIYEEPPNPLFMVFMTVPLYFVYGLRYLFERNHITSAERKVVFYSTLLLVFSLVVFPAITFRFAIFAVPLQIFIVTLSDRCGIKTGVYAMLGMLVHLCVMMSISNNYSVLING